MAETINSYEISEFYWPFHLLILSTIIYLWLMIKIISNKFLIYDPVMTSMAMLIFLFILRPFSMIINGEVFFYRDLYIYNQISNALLYSGISIVVFIFAYELAQKVTIFQTKIRSLLQKEYEFCAGRTLYYYCFLLVFIGFVFFAIQLYGFGSGSLINIVSFDIDSLAIDAKFKSEYFTLAPLLTSVVASLVILINEGSLSRKKKILIFFMIVYPTISFFMLGNRRFMLPAVIVPLFCYFYKNGYQVQWLKPRNILTTILLLLLVISIPYLRQHESRESYGGSLNFVSNLISEPSSIINKITLGPDSEMFSVFAAQINTLNNTGYYYGSASLGDLVLAPIPSAIFPKQASPQYMVCTRLPKDLI